MLKEMLITIAAAITGYWLWKNRILADWTIGQQIALVIGLYILGLFFEKGLSSNEVDDDDIFIDNAPNPTPSPTNPPTSEQIEFVEFMKKQREQEGEKELIRRE